MLCKSPPVFAEMGLSSTILFFVPVLHAGIFTRTTNIHKNNKVTLRRGARKSKARISRFSAFYNVQETPL